MTDGAKSGNSERETSTSRSDSRSSALAFTEGVRSGWLTSDLIAWTREHLVNEGRITLAFGSNVSSIREPDFGIILLSDHAGPPATTDRVAELSEMPGLLTAARNRVLEHLGETIATGQSRFVQAAIYGERIIRTRINGRSCWRANLNERTALSDQVLALFAADALESPSDYEQSLAVCDACGMISIGQDLACARGCPAHPYGTLDPATIRHSGLRSGIIPKIPARSGQG